MSGNLTLNKTLLLFMFLFANTLIFDYAYSVDKKTIVQSESLGSIITKCLDGNTTIDDVKKSINNGADVYADFNGFSPMYILLNYIIKTPIKDCNKAIDLLNILVNEGKIDVNKRHRILLPPLAYLMRENLSYLGGKYNSNYIPDSIIKLLLDNGANINTLDQNGDNLLKFAVNTSNNNLYKYLTNKGININRINQAGQDPLYLVVSSQNTTALQNLINSGYKITPSKIISTGVDKILNQAKNNSQFVSIFSKNCALNVISLEDARNYKKFFPDWTHFLVANDFHISNVLKIGDFELKEFIQIVNINSSILSQTEKNNLDYLKQKYNSYLHNIYFDLKSKSYSCYSIQIFSDNQYDDCISKCKELIKLIEQNNFDPENLENKLYYLIDYYLIISNNYLFATESYIDYLSIVWSYIAYSMDVPDREVNEKKYKTEIEKIQELIILCDNLILKSTDHSDKITIQDRSNKFKKLYELKKYQFSKDIDDYNQYIEELNSRLREKKEKICKECVIDLDKSTFPKEEERGIFLTYTVHNPGKIVMKNGEKYEFYFSDNKWEIQDGIIFIDKTRFEKLVDLVKEFERRCRKEKCNY